MAMAASVQIPWRASPILVGRWGWSDPGSDFSLTGAARWDAEERLGDLVLAGERRAGAGRVVVLGDTGSFTNSGNIWANRFTSRLLAYLASESGSPQVWWRQLIGLLLIGGLVVLWYQPVRVERIAASMLVLLLAVSAAQALTCRSWEILPDGRSKTPNNLAYLDASHLEAYAETPWAVDGIDGFALTLMRNGFLVLAADDLSSERLHRAAMVVSVAPARRFSSTQRDNVKDFVENGGVLIAIAGATHGRHVSELLEPLGLGVPEVYYRPGTRNPAAEPFGRLDALYPEGEEPKGHVGFHAAWPVNLFGQNAMAVASTEAKQPIVAFSAVGQGVAVVVGDTYFAANKALENQDGATLTGDRANAEFWRWLIGDLPGHIPWEPPTVDKGNDESKENGSETAPRKETQP
jgi:hypothetical protein